MVCVCCYNVSVPIGLYGFQHYLSMLGSIILIPLVIVPAMGGTYVSSYKHVLFFLMLYICVLDGTMLDRLI